MENSSASIFFYWNINESKEGLLWSYFHHYIPQNNKTKNYKFVLILNKINLECCNSKIPNFVMFSVLNGKFLLYVINNINIFVFIKRNGDILTSHLSVYLGKEPILTLLIILGLGLPCLDDQQIFIECVSYFYYQLIQYLQSDLSWLSCLSCCTTLFLLLLSICNRRSSTFWQLLLYMLLLLGMASTHALPSSYIREWLH